MRFLLLIFLCTTFNSLFAQKKALTVYDSDKWKSLSSTQISNKGQFVHYLLKPQVGDNKLVLHKGENIDTFYRADNPQFLGGEQFLIYSIKPAYELVKELKLKKTKKDDMPMDSLHIISLKNDTSWKIENVKSYQTAKNHSTSLAYLYNPTVIEIADSVNKKSDSLKVEKKKSEPKISKKREKQLKDAATLVVRDLVKNTSYSFINVSQYQLADNGKEVFFCSLGDSTFKEGAYLLNVATGQLKPLHLGIYDFNHTAQDTILQQWAWVANLDSVYTSKKDKRIYNLYHYLEKTGFQLLGDTQILGNGKRVNPHQRPYFSSNAERLFFQIQPKAIHYEKDTTILPEEEVKVDIWSHHDKRLQPEQLSEKSKDLKNGLDAYYFFKKKEIRILSENVEERINVAEKNSGNWALAFDNGPYQKSRSWESPWAKDVYLIDLKKQNRTLFKSNFMGYINFSPKGNYLIWFDQNDSNWFVFNLAKQQTINLTGQLKVPFYNEFDDHPALPNAHGQGGWLEDDAALLLYDAFDIWIFDPSGKEKPKKITNGRKEKYRNRMVFTEVYDGFWPKTEAVFISSFDTKTKNERLDFLQWEGLKLEKGAEMAASLNYLSTAKESGFHLFRRGTSTSYPELYLSKKNHIQPAEWQLLSHTNPQQEKYKWYQTELINYLSADGDSLQGILYAPENYNPNLQYPMVVYFYEQLSDYLHSYQSPRPSASTISRAIYCSNDYFVFVPDIVYRDGLPGKSAFNCIMPGVLKILETKPCINKNKLALQGQSWGGYQTAYLITQTKLFAAAMAGAPVVNMTSAYGGIRWGSGMSRAFQYEHGQSRIGASLWQAPLNYLENSPLFFADRVVTPLLIMHNDGDGAVPYYQGIEYFSALRRLEKEVWMLVYNGEEHNLMKRHNRVDLSLRMMAFFDHYLKGKEMPNWMKNGLPATEKGLHLGY